MGIRQQSQLVADPPDMPLRAILVMAHQPLVMPKFFDDARCARETIMCVAYEAGQHTQSESGRGGFQYILT